MTASHLYASKHGAEFVARVIANHGGGMWTFSVEGFTLVSTGAVEMGGEG